MRRGTRIALLAGTVAAAAVAAVAGPRLAVQALETRVRAALGERVEVGAIGIVGWTALELRGVRVAAPADWPVRDALRVERVVLRPRLASLLDRQVAVEAVELQHPHLAVRRVRGRPLEALPGLAAGDDARAPREGDPRAGPPVRIERVTLVDGTIDLHDATVARPPHRTRLADLDATVHDVEMPAVTRPSRLELTARLAGARRHGRLSVRGTITPGSADARLTIDVSGADLAAFRPYLTGGFAARVRGGSADLHLEPTVRAGRVDAPGRLAIHDLSLAGGSGVVERLLDLPRAAALRILADGRGTIRIGFVIEGPLGATRIRVTDHPGRQLAAAMGSTLGASPSGAATGLAAVGGAAVDGVETTARGTARAVARLFRLGGGR